MVISRKSEPEFISSHTGKSLVKDAPLLPEETFDNPADGLTTQRFKQGQKSPLRFEVLFIGFTRRLF